MLAMAVWNGATFYIDVFSARYRQQFEKLKALQFKYDQMEIAMDSTVPVDQHDALNVQLSVLRPLVSLTWAH